MVSHLDTIRRPPLPLSADLAYTCMSDPGYVRWGTSHVNTLNTTQQSEVSNTADQIAQASYPLLGLHDDPSGIPAEIVFQRPTSEAQPGSGAS